ncbi:MAG: glucose-1-phosphate thymidylyltransferase [Symbiobacteriaceae bacterium]|nr:glucose-1-phosphate thymidylyltransferase [Symbiobacteriaceae bacterium]
MFAPQDFFDLNDEPLAELFTDCVNVWDVLKNLPQLVQNLTAEPVILGEVHPTAVLSGPVYVGENSIIGPHVHIRGPVYIGKNTELRHGAYLRENTIVSDGCVVGHDSETKGSIMLKNSHAPHFAYVGDSILGRGVNLGAGTKLANFKLEGNEVFIQLEDQRISTGLRKLGAIIGDGVSIGCNAVTAPGTLIGKNSWIYSLISLRGVIPADSIIKPATGYTVAQKRKGS